ncbi:Cof-type HAD-IIB family hydrolase [Clostridium sp.]|uniref:Cof-type HAD-IIB family hydrolase n=1 Tax=Clostridium sp. TaxID=1506 RepID=UPI002FC6150D
MKYKLVCLDMDGTLLNSEKKISEKNLLAIKRAHELGVKVAICTGRIFTSAYYYGNLIGVEAPIIASNGAYIREKDRNEVIYKAILGYENCKDILSIFEKYDIIPHFFTSDTIFAEKLAYFSQYYSEANKKMPKENQVEIKITTEWEKIFKENELEIIKAVAADEDLNKILRAKEEIKKLGTLEVVSSSQNNFEVMSKEASKGRGVEILSDFYGLHPDEIICIGDNENDISMIQFAGLGVAMGNSDKSVKEIANYITSSNDEDGVARVIEEFILQNNNN